MTKHRVRNYEFGSAFGKQYTTILGAGCAVAGAVVGTFSLPAGFSLIILGATIGME